MESFSAPTLEELSICNSPSFPVSLRQIVALALSLSLSLTLLPLGDSRVTQDNPGVTKDDPGVTQNDPRVTQDDPRVTQDDHRATTGWLWVPQG